MSRYGYKSKSNEFFQFPLEEHEKNDNDSNVVFNIRMCHLNKSGSKYVSVGFNMNFEECVKISGNKGFLVLSEREWKTLLNYQACILNYFYSKDEDYSSPLEFEEVKIFFEKMDENIHLIKIFKNGFYVYLGCETVHNLFQLTPFINQKICSLKKQHFGEYFNTFKSSLNYKCGNILDTVYNVLLSRKDQCNENDLAMMELVLVYPTFTNNKLKL